MIKSFVRRLFRGRAFKRKLPQGASLYVTSDSQLKYLNPGHAGFDVELLKIVDEFVEPGAEIWDIGANVGVFTFAAAAKGARVLAVEPDPYMASLMLRSRALPGNVDRRIDILAGAVSNRAGISEIRFARGGRASNALKEVSGTRSDAFFLPGSALVPTVTLDSLLEFSPNPSFLKIDVEGAEFLALSGGVRLLSEVRPRIYFEAYSENAAQVVELLNRHGYRLYDGDAPRPRKQVDGISYNTLAIPG